MRIEQREKTKQFFIAQGPILSRADLVGQGIGDRGLQDLLQDGSIFRVRQGYYQWNVAHDLSDFAVIQGIVPEGVFSLFTSAVFHDLTTVNPMRLHMTIPRTKRKPIVPDYPPVDFYYISEELLKLGQVVRDDDGVNICVYDAERTVCDFFKYQNRTGKDAAEEVIKNYFRSKTRNIQKLYDYAERLRVLKHIKNYTEILA